MSVTLTETTDVARSLDYRDYLTDEREAWLNAVLDAFEWDVVLRVADVLCRHANWSGVAEVPRRKVMADASIDKTYVYEKAIRNLEDAGFIYRENPGTAPRITAQYSLVLNSTFIGGGLEDDAPRLKPGRKWDFKVGRNNHGKARSLKESSKGPSKDDPIWLERRPYCRHTLRTCTPECPDYGGRGLA